ncbi:hypothetical protein V5799_033310 [Amblyomma americanum]|uniref:Uncharacterized protein n=1 Tax=Amblyomma americanum TaxID=6943 RepID=A0AAQ4DNP1_AMBAM
MTASPSCRASSRVETRSAIESAVHLPRRKPVSCSGRKLVTRAIQAAPGGSDVRGDLLARVPRPQQGDPSGPELPGPRSYLRPRGYHFGQGPGQFPCPGPPPPEYQGKPQAPGAHCIEHLPACGLDGLPAHRRCLPSTRQTPAPPELNRGMLQHTEKQPLGQSLAPPEGSGPSTDPQASHPGHCHRKGHQHRGPG